MWKSYAPTKAEDIDTWVFEERRSEMANVKGLFNCSIICNFYLSPVISLLFPLINWG